MTRPVVAERYGSSATDRRTAFRVWRLQSTDAKRGDGS